MTTQNERLIIVLNVDGSIKSATVFPIQWLSETEARNLAPLDLVDVAAELPELAAMFSAPTVAARDQLAAQLEAITTERDQLAGQVATLAAQRDQLAGQVEQLGAVTLERDQLAGQVQTLTAERDQLAAQLDAINNPPGPDLSTVDGAKQFITAQRYDNETAGFSVGGQFISTERDEIGHWFPRYFNAYQWTIGDAATRAGNPAGLYPFKPKNHSPTILTAAQVLRVYDCMTWFINSCFAVEAAAYARLDAGDAIADVLGALEWPQTSFDWQPPAA